MPHPLSRLAIVSFDKLRMSVEGSREAGRMAEPL